LLRPLRADCRENAVKRPRLTGGRAGTEGLAAAMARRGLLLMPDEQHVFLAITAGVANQRKGQIVFAGPTELINARTFAVFRSFAAGALNGNGIPGDCVGAPDVAFAVVVSIDIERAVSLDRPDGAERVVPCTGQRGWTGARSSSAGAY
jgi:hypothetical protein